MRFSEVDKGKFSGLVDNGWCACRIAQLYGWKKYFLKHYVYEHNSKDIFVSKTDNCSRNRKTTAQTYLLIAKAVVCSP